MLLYSFLGGPPWFGNQKEEFVNYVFPPQTPLLTHSASLQETTFGCVFHSLQPDPDAEAFFRGPLILDKLYIFHLARNTC